MILLDVFSKTSFDSIEPSQGETLSTPPPTPSEAQQKGQSEAETSSSQADQSPARSKRARSKSTRYDDFVDPSELTRNKRRTSGTLQDEKESEPLSKRRKQQLSTEDNNANGEANHQGNSTTSSSSEDAPPKTEEKPEVKITVLPPTPLLPSEEVIMCKVCGKGDNDEKLLLCDGCDAGYHTFCVSPPLEEIPSGDWFCQNCTSQGKHQKRSLTAIAAEAVPLSVSIAICRNYFLHLREILTSTLGRRQVFNRRKSDCLLERRLRILSSIY